MMLQRTGDVARRTLKNSYRHSEGSRNLQNDGKHLPVNMMVKHLPVNMTNNPEQLSSL
jgi:hypothetical protein